VVAHLAKVLAKHNLSEEQIHAMMIAWNDHNQGEPVGTVKRDPATGLIAHRVEHNGLHLWRVTSPDDKTSAVVGAAQYNDQQPTLAWVTLWPLDRQ
jgi:hypothetical protein